MHRARRLDRPEDGAGRITSFDPMAMRQAHIGSSLRRLYQGVSASQLPQQFDALLAELDRIERPRRRD